MFSHIFWRHPGMYTNQKLFSLQKSTWGWTSTTSTRDNVKPTLGDIKENNLWTFCLPATPVERVRVCLSVMQVSERSWNLNLLEWQTSPIGEWRRWEAINTKTGLAILCSSKGQGAFQEVLRHKSKGQGEELAGNPNIVKQKRRRRESKDN